MNILFGKFCQGNRKFRNFKVTQSAQELNKYTCLMYLKHVKRISDNICLVELKRRSVKLNRPLIAGAQILEYSRLLMYQTAFLEFEKIYTRNCLQLLLTDTDSFLFQLKSMESDPFRALLPIKHLLETSSFPSDHVLYREIADKDKLGLLQIETGHKNIITEFFGLKSKLYWASLWNYHEQKADSYKRAKGANTATQNTLEEKHFRQCLFDKIAHRVDQRTIRSYNEQLYTVKTNREILNTLDFKRYVLSDGVNTLPFGYIEG